MSNKIPANKILPARCPLCCKFMEFTESIDLEDGYITLRYNCYHNDGVVDYAISYRYYSNEELEID